MTSTPPRSIDGTIGSKIRIILGETGDNWLLLLNHDDGNSKWQQIQWSAGIPSQLAKQINNCVAKDRYIKEVDFGLNNGWYVSGIKRDGSGDHCWWSNTTAGSAINEKMTTSSSRLQVSFGSDINLERYGCDDGDDKLETYAILEDRRGDHLFNSMDNDLLSRTGRIHKKNKIIDFIRQWKGVGEHCAKQLQKNEKIEDISVTGDGSWVVIHADRYTESTGVDDDLCQQLTQFYNDQRERKNRRNLEIQEYHARTRREEAREREEQEQEQVQRLALEAAERLELERQREIEAAAFLERQQQREVAEREAREVDRIIKELKDTSEQGKCLKKKRCQESRNNNEHEERLKKKRRSLRASIEKIPPQARARIDNDGYNLNDIMGNGDNCATITTNSSSNMSSSPATANCVICQVAPSSHAIIPCGHCCLCDECATTLTGGPPQTRLCPLCRTQIQSCLKIFLSTG